MVDARLKEIDIEVIGETSTREYVLQSDSSQGKGNIFRGEQLAYQ